MSIQKVLVTGSDGRIGSVTVQELRDHGYEVTGADLHPKQPWGTKIVDFEDLGQVLGIMHAHDAVIHLAAIPNPLQHTAEVVFRNNVMSTFNVLEAATILGINNIVMASSISALGHAFPFNHFNPERIPIVEDDPMRSQDCYGLSKMVGETLCEGFHRRTPTMSLKSLRFTSVLDERNREFFVQQVNENQEPTFSGAFWTFIDVRDCATSCRLAMEYTEPGHEAFYINASHIYTRQPVEELLRKHFPDDYPIADHIKGSTSPVDPGKAERLLGFKPRYNYDGTEL